MNDAQKLIFTELVVIFALKFGLLTKFSELWNLAFKASAVTGQVGKF